jgi:hypothetical protein
MSSRILLLNKKNPTILLACCLPSQNPEKNIKDVTKNAKRTQLAKNKHRITSFHNDNIESPWPQVGTKTRYQNKRVHKLIQLIVQTQLTQTNK